MTDYLYLSSHLFSLEILAFVLMPNHFHLLLRTPKGNISEAMNYFMRETSREITRISGRINQTYGNRHHKTLISSHHYFMNAYKYIYRNPVRANLCSRVEHYRYSTLAGLVGNYPMAIPMVEDTLLFSPHFNFHHLEWLNVPSEVAHEEEIRKALRRSTFKLAASAKSKKPSDLETLLI